MGSGPSKEELAKQARDKAEVKEYEAKWPEIRAKIEKNYKKAIPHILYCLQRFIVAEWERNEAVYMSKDKILIPQRVFFDNPDPTDSFYEEIKEHVVNNMREYINRYVLDPKRKHFVFLTSWRNKVYWSFEHPSRSAIEFYFTPTLHRYNKFINYSKNCELKEWLKKKILDDNALQEVLDKPVAEWFNENAQKLYEERKLEKEFEQEQEQKMKRERREQIRKAKREYQEQFEAFKRRKQGTEHTAVLPEPQEPRELEEGEVEGKPNIEGQ